MSLIDPTKLEAAVTWIKTPSMGRKALMYAVGGLVVIGVILFASDRISNWWGSRQIDKLRTNVNIATAELKQSQANVTAEKQAEQKALENVNAAVKEYANAANATESAKSETNRALENLASAVNANRPVGITANELEKQLKELDQ